MRHTRLAHTARKSADHADFQLFELLFGPSRGSAAYTDAADGRHAIAPGDDLPRQIGNTQFEISTTRIHHHVTYARRISDHHWLAGHHDNLAADRLSKQRLHHCAADLPRTTDDDHAKLWIHNLSPARIARD